MPGIRAYESRYCSLHQEDAERGLSSPKLARLQELELMKEADDAALRRTSEAKGCFNSDSQASKGARHTQLTHARVLRLHGASRVHATGCHARVARRAQAPPRARSWRAAPRCECAAHLKALFTYRACTGRSLVNVLRLRH